MKNKKLTIIFLTLILVAIGTVAVIFIGYRQVATAPEQLLSSIKDGANLSLGKIRQTATRDGKKEWRLEAGSAHYIENDKKAVLKDLFIIYFLKDNREVHLEAEEGILKTDTNDIEFSGNVVIKSEDYQLKTRRMNYEHERRVIFTNSPVQISGEAVSLSAQSIRYDLNLDKISLAGNVEVAISEGFADLPGLGDGEQ